MSVAATPAYEFFDLKPSLRDMRGAVLEGLREAQKRISPMYFYDEAGSKLFERITQLPEYYPTRTEISLFDAYSDEIAGYLGEGVCLVEYGSGSSRKIRKLLETARPAAYVPVDISGEHLEDNARQLHADFDWLSVYPVCADFSEPLELPAPVAAMPKAGFFPGSSIGNFEPEAAVKMLRNMHDTLGSGGHMLLGVDRKKDRRLLEAAYDDAAGVTAQFNLNALRHVNARLDADFDLAQFRHRAVYNEEIGAVQMFLVSDRAQQVSVAGESFAFAEGEALHTENSFKYHPAEFVALAARAGFEETAHWSDAQDWFSVFLLTAR